MKGTQGLVIAVALGITGAVCNWLYMAQQATNYERVAFLAVGNGMQIEAGDKFTEAHFIRIDIPKSDLGNLEKTAVKWSDLNVVVGHPATKDYIGGEIILNQDLRTPAKEDLNNLIGKDERVIWLPVDSRTFNPQHVNPGDQVSFKVPRHLGRNPQPAGSKKSPPLTVNEIIGPFRILALGNRKGRRDIRTAAGLSSGSENVIAISVQVRSNQLEPKAERISGLLQMTNFQGVQVLLHPAAEENN